MTQPDSWATQRQLSDAGRLALLYILSRPLNGDTVHLPWQQAIKELGWKTRKPWYAALNNLIIHGVIERTETAGVYRLCSKGAGV